MKTKFKYNYRENPEFNYIIAIAVVGIIFGIIACFTALGW
jgi:hypothetical protein